MKIRNIMLGLCVHCTISWMLWGSLQVYQRGYNAMHSEPIAMASAAVNETTAEIRVLQQRLRVPAAWFAEDSPLYTICYCVTGEELHLWMYLASAVEEILCEQNVHFKFIKYRKIAYCKDMKNLL